MSQVHTRYEFGDFTLDVSQQRLLRRDTGKVIPITGKVFDTLVYLVEHAGELLGKDVLLAAIWPGLIVEENSLTQNISTLRQTLGETRGENRYVATIPRKGYRFVAAVTRSDAPALPAFPGTATATKPPMAPPAITRRRIGLLIAGLAALVVVIAMLGLPGTSKRPAKAPLGTGSTLAILPFKPLLPADRNESLELGMAESLISRLGQHSPGLVSPLSSVRRFATLDQDAIAAGRTLGVNTVLDGSLQRSGDRLRVSARLLRVADGRQLWAQDFDQDFTTIFDVQDAIAARIAQALSVRWAGPGSTRGAPYTSDPEAYALYANGRVAWTRHTEASLLQAIGFFEQAIARDPHYALAYTGLADSLAVLGVFGIRAPNDVFPGARRAATKALAIDPDLAAAHAALGHVLLQYEHDSAGAAREYARAMSLDPSLALIHHRRGLLLAMQGDADGALMAFGRAQELEPLWLSPRVAVGCYHYYLQHYDESIRLLEQVLALDDRAPNARACMIRSLIAKGAYNRAFVELDKGSIQAPGSDGLRAEALALAGRRAEARAELDRILGRSKQHYVAAYDIASIYAALAEIDNTFLWLERAMPERSTQLLFLAQDPMFAALHADPRFASLVQRIGVFRQKLR